MNSVSIVIPTWNGVELLKQFLPSVMAAALRYREQAKASVEIVIVDDSSEDDSVAWLVSRGFEETGREQRPPSQVELRFLRNEKNLGFGKACNRGVAAARHDLVFLLNNDVEVDCDAIAPLASHFGDPSVFAVHCRVIEFETGKECGLGQKGSFARGFIRVHSGYALRGKPVGPLHSIFASGGSAMFDRKKFLDIGAFDELLSPAYWEDVELSYRAWKRGLAILYEPHSTVRHRVSSTMRRLNRRKIRRIQQRNRLIFHWIDLHDRRLFASHVMWVLMLALSAPIRLQPGFILSLIDAFKKLPAIGRRRRQEREAAKRTDREVLRLFEELKKRKDITLL